MLELPERITPLEKVYRHEELARFFAACSDLERALFATFLLTGFREQEVMFLYWSNVNFKLRTVRATAKPELGFYPERWEDREVPAPAEFMDELRKHIHARTANLCFHPLTNIAGTNKRHRNSSISVEQEERIVLHPRRIFHDPSCAWDFLGFVTQRHYVTPRHGISLSRMFNLSDGTVGTD